MSIPVAYEDDWLLIADKPPGLLVIPAPRSNQRTLTGILNDELKNKGISYRLHPCHRIDRETSGLVIYAKGKSVQKKMMRLFKEQKVRKAYIAFTQGSLPLNAGQIRCPIEGLSAYTKYRVIAKRRDFDIVEIMPLSGRTNQIRIHFKSIGHPLVGETKFAFRRDYQLKAKRVCLHAKTLQFLHPITNKHIKVDSELAGDLEKFLKLHSS